MLIVLTISAAPKGGGCAAECIGFGWLLGSVGTCYGQFGECRSLQLGSAAYMRTQEREVGRSQPVGGGLGLVPERVDQRWGADLVEGPALSVGELGLGGPEVVG